MSGSLELVGADVKVPLVGGGSRRYVNLDYAASAPCLMAVKHAVDALLPWYSSVHRGAGYKSMLATEAYEGARVAVRSFLNARGSDAVVFTRNTTDGMNLLASTLPQGAQVIAFETEHHANLLPWRRHDVTTLPAPSGPAEALERLEQALQRSCTNVRLVPVTGASNVTGEIWPYPEIIRLAHRYGARVVLDAAQLAPHRRIDMTALDVDYLAMSGHKLYAPFGTGVLVGRADWLGQGEPFIAGGGAVRYVTGDDVLWADLPDRQEAGSPNVVGAVALGVACRTLEVVGMDAVAEHEDALLNHALDRLSAMPGIELYRLWTRDHPRIGVVPFNLAGYPYAQLAAILSAEHAVGVRHGCFCAHPMMVRLLQVSRKRSDHIRAQLVAGRSVKVPGAVRASMGLGTSWADISRLLNALKMVAQHGPRWQYRSSPDGGDCWPDPDPRPRADLPFDLLADHTAESPFHEPLRPASPSVTSAGSPAFALSSLGPAARTAPSTP